VKQYDNRSVTFVEIACSYARYVDEFFSDHAAPLVQKFIILVHPLRWQPLLFYHFDIHAEDPRIRQRFVVDTIVHAP